MNLIIDGNAFINVAISVTKSVTLRDKLISEVYYVEDLLEDGFKLKDKVRISFRNFCFTYLNSLISATSTPPDEVHIVFDSKSWRKEYTDNFFNRHIRNSQCSRCSQTSQCIRHYFFIRRNQSN